MDYGQSVTDHMCHDLSLFYEHKHIERVGAGNHITIPNGKQVSITHVGIVHLKYNIMLQDVLYVPDFK